MGFLDWLGGVGSSLISGAAGTAANMIGAKQQQGFQREMFDKQKEFWYEQQDYNSPVNQVKRLNEAGLNPQFMLGNIQSGSMGSIPSPGTGSASQTGNFGDITSNMLNLVRGKTEKKLADVNIRNIEADATLKEITGVTQGMRELAEIGEIISRTDKQLGEAILSRVSANSQQVMTGIAQDKSKLEMTELQTRIDNNVIQNMIAIEELKVLPQRNKLLMQQIGADIALKLATKELTLEQAKRIWFESNDLWQTAEGKRIDNEIKNKSFSYIVDRAAKEAVSGVGLTDLFGAGIMGLWHQFKK